MNHNFLTLLNSAISLIYSMISIWILSFFHREYMYFNPVWTSISFLATICPCGSNKEVHYSCMEKGLLKGVTKTKKNHIGSKKFLRPQWSDQLTSVGITYWESLLSHPILPFGDFTTTGNISIPGPKATHFASDLPKSASSATKRLLEPPTGQIWSNRFYFMPNNPIPLYRGGVKKILRPPEADNLMCQLGGPANKTKQTWHVNYWLLQGQFPPNKIADEMA